MDIKELSPEQLLSKLLHDYYYNFIDEYESVETEVLAQLRERNVIREWSKENKDTISHSIGKDILSIMNNSRRK
jgi:hypothetical protein